MATQTTMTTSTTTAANMFAKSTPPVRVERIKLYKDFLTPLLHRRFCAAAGAILLVCGFDSWLLSSSGSLLWSWFPIGPTGVRSSLLFIPCLAVFVVRVANLHTGELTSSSPAQTVHARLTGASGVASTVNTILWYLFSGWLFGEIYIWSRTETAELSMIDPGKAYERPRLNENPIFLRCLFAVLAVIQAVLHLVRDYDSVDIIAAEKEREQRQKEQEQLQKEIAEADNRVQPSLVAKLPRFIRVFGRNFWNLVRRTANLLVGGTFIVPLYYGFLRGPIWKWTYFFARIVLHELPEYAPPTGLLHFAKLFWQAFTSSVMLITLWEISNLAFDTFVAQAPLKKGEPLTSEIKDGRGVVLHKSKDPNGSLITGLKSKKALNKSFAFWELDIICTSFDNRRKTIYTEVDRKDGNTWAQICKILLQEIKGIQERITTATEPVDFKKKQAEEALLKQQQADYLLGMASEDTGLKKIGDRRVIEDGDVFAKRTPDLANAFGNMARSIGQSPGGIDPVTPRARKLIKYGADQVLSKEDQERLQPRYLEKQAGGYLTQLLRTPAGEPFRQTFTRRVNATVFGTPTSRKADILHAVKALAKLTIRSLEEDTYGQVQKDIANIVRTLTEVIKAIEKYVKELQPHWTDVEFRERNRDVAEVREVVELLKMGLAEIILVFEEYASTLGLTRKDVRDAKDASKTVGWSEMREAI